MQALLAQGATVNAKEKKGLTALMLAANACQSATAKVLLAHGADIDAKAKNDGTALMFAAEKGHDDTVLALLLNGASVSVKQKGATALMLAENNGHTKTARLLTSPLHGAAAQGVTRAVGTLLAKGGDANQRDEHGWTPLMWASKGSHLDTVRALLLKGTCIQQYPDHVCIASQGRPDQRREPETTFRDWTVAEIKAQAGIR